MSKFEVAGNIIEELEEKLERGEYAFEAPRGRIVVSDRVPVAGIQLNGRLGEYLDFISKLDDIEKPNLAQVIPREKGKFQIIINAPVVLKDGHTYVNGRKVTLL